MLDSFRKWENTYLLLWNNHIYYEKKEKHKIHIYKGDQRWEIILE